MTDRPHPGELAEAARGLLRRIAELKLAIASPGSLERRP